MEETKPLLTDDEAIKAFCAVDESPWRTIRDIYEANRLQLEARIRELEEDRNNLRTFIENIINWNRVEYLDGGDVQDEAERMGILVQVPHQLPCTVENCGCEGEYVDYLYQFGWSK